MDTLSEVFDDIRSCSAMLGRNHLRPPWRIRVETPSSLGLIAMLDGSGVLLPEPLGSATDPVPLGPGDVAIVTGPGPFDVVSDLDPLPELCYVLGADGSCRDASGCDVDAELSGGTRHCGTPHDGAHTVLTGSYATTGRIADRLLTALPRALVVPADLRRSPALDLLDAALDHDAPGQRAVLDRLLDLLLLDTLRTWFELPGTKAPRWYLAAGDPVVGPALAAIHADPARRWTVESLAERAQVSRAAFARAFTETMGEAPITYLTNWRLCLAADRLTGSDDTVESIARRGGYASAFGLSAAFQRLYGVRPSEHRRTAHV